MLKCLIVEDDYTFALDTKITVEEIGLSVVSIASNFSEIEYSLSKYKVDIILSDVQLAKDQFANEFFEQKQNLPPIIFFSVFSDVSTYEKTLKAKPYVFLPKPFDKMALQSAIEGALRAKKLAISTGGEINKSEGTIFIRSKGQLVSVDPRQINFVKSEGNYCTLHIKKKKVVIRSSIAKVMQIINSPDFVQIHRAHIANLNAISKIHIPENEVSINGAILPIGKKYKRNLIELIDIKNA